MNFQFHSFGIMKRGSNMKTSKSSAAIIIIIFLLIASLFASGQWKIRYKLYRITYVINFSYHITSLIDVRSRICVWFPCARWHPQIMMVVYFHSITRSVPLIFNAMIPLTIKSLVIQVTSWQIRSHDLGLSIWKKFMLISKWKSQGYNLKVYNVKRARGGPGAGSSLDKRL